MRVANVASVMVTAMLPAFADPGTKIDATASAIGDASNLQGGMLLMTSLRGANGQTYAVAQGAVVTGGGVPELPPPPPPQALNTDSSVATQRTRARTVRVNEVDISCSPLT